MSGPQRRASILEAASRVFERTGDLGSTTTKMIAQEAGVNEATLYRHFDTKEDLFYAAVVEPLQLPIREFFSQVELPEGPMSADERQAFLSRVMYSMVVRLSGQLGGLGLVLFGNPETARRFYEAAWEPAVRELAEGWRAIFDRAGLKDYNDPYLSAHVVVGTCLMVAISRRLTGDSDRGDDQEMRERCSELARMMYSGAFAYDD
jgi:AcrR family transcriptional regulator